MYNRINDHEAIAHFIAGWVVTALALLPLAALAALVGV